MYGPTPGSSVRSSGQPRAGDRTRRAVEVERAPVVPEPLPLADHVGGGRRRERLDRGPALEPGAIARNDALDLRLLEHHLADEDRVRVARPPPRQVAAVLREPGEELLLHRGTLPIPGHAMTTTRGRTP